MSRFKKIPRRKEETLETVQGSIIKAAGRSPAVRHRPRFTGFERAFALEADVRMAAEAKELHQPKETNEGKIF